ncbi:MAG: Bcr/CflA family efflux MFS transporter [Proteobacteria bacterium]|nr:Bcr/CflA family efflux MFS transporter [Pseudomonadota bacterium]
MNSDIQSAVPPASRRLLIAILLASVAYGLLAMTACLPSMPSWAGLFGVEQASVQLTFSAFVIAYGGAQVFYGPLSDRHGRRRLLLLGFALAALGSLACALATQLPMLIAARALQGVGAAAGMVIGRAMVQDFFSGADKPRMMAYTGMVLGMCPPTATLLGGQMEVHFGWRANFAVLTVLALVLLVAAWRVLPRTERKVSVHEHWLAEMFAAYRALAKQPVFLGYGVILAMCTGSFYVFLAGTPLVLASYGVGPARVGLFIMAVPLSYIAGNFVVSRLLHAKNEARLALIGQCAACAGPLLALALALAGVRSPLALALPMTLLGFGHGLLMPSTLSGTISVIPTLAGSAVAASGLAQQLFGALGGWAVGLVPHDDARYMAAMMLTFMLLALVMQVLVMRLRAAVAS